MRYGMNLLLWADTLSDEALPLLDEIKEIGFDAVELPVFEADVKKYAKWGKHLDGMGLARTGVTVRGAEDNPMSPDPKAAARASRRTRRRWSAARRRAARRWSARTIRPWATSAAPATKDEWRWAVEGMREVAEHAEKCRVTLALEYLSRFECYLLNTAVDGARFCRDVNHRAAR